MTLNEIYAKIQTLEKEIQDLEYRKGHIQTTTPETKKQYWNGGDWEWRTVGGAVIDTSAERSRLERKLEEKKRDLQDLESAYEFAEKERQEKYFREQEQEAKIAREKQQEEMRANWEREQKEINWRAAVDRWNNSRSSLYRFFHNRNNPTRIYEKLDQMSAEQINDLYKKR